MKNRALTSPPQQPSLATLKTFLPYLWPDHKPDLKQRIAGAVVLLFISKMASIFIPVFYKLAVESLQDYSLPNTASLLTAPLFVISLYGIVRITSQAFSEFKDILFATVGQNAFRTIALSVFQQLHALSLRFHLDRKTGSLSSIIDKGIKGIESLMRFMLFNIVPTFLEIVLVAVILWAIYDIRFALVTCLTLLGYVFFTLRFTEWRTNFVRSMNKIDAEASTKTVDSLLNYETVKYFGNEQHEISRYDQSLACYQAAALKSAQSLSWLNIGQGIIISIGLVIVMLMAAQEVRAGRMTVGDFVLVNTYLIQLYLPLNILGFAYREIKMALVNMENMFQLLKEPQEIQDYPQALPLDLENGQVEFRNVFFSYQGDRPILKGIDFTIPGGKTTAIVGSSGAGKSTIARLLFRFYDVTDGAILIDGQDIRSLTQHSLRQSIGVVPQDTVLFNETIYYNIAYGRLDASRDEVENAARLAEIHDFILSLPQGYDTTVGERGLKLSGGEKQRVAIARTLLKNPTIFMYDEATSALDTNTEKAIQKSLKAISAHHTTLIIAHRLSTIIDADEILVLEKGKIVERGTHQMLLAHKGVYATLWTRQQEHHPA